MQWLLTLLHLLFRPRIALIAEKLFLRKQVLREREAKPRRTTPSVRPTMVALGKLFDWRSALVIVQPATFITWHRTMFRGFWRWKSRRRGRPPLPRNLRELVREMAGENPTWGEERIANELKLKLGVKVSPRTVGKYLQGYRPTGTRKDQSWSRVAP